MNDYQVNEIYNYKEHYFVVMEANRTALTVKWLTDYYEFGGNVTKVFANSLIYENSKLCQ
jgi:Ca2+-binding EF-hand superfamily protein